MFRLSPILFLAACATSTDLGLEGEPDATAPESADLTDLADVELAELADLEGPIAAAAGVLADRHELEVDDLVATRVNADEFGLRHVRVRQEVDGVPVFTGDAILHLDADGGLVGTTDKLLHAPDVGTTPDLDAAAATELALDDAEADDVIDEPELMILRHDEADHLVWRVDTEVLADDGTPVARPRVFVDAHSGEIVWGYDNLVSGTGTSSYNGSVTVTSSKSGSYYYLKSSRGTTYSYGNTTSTTSQPKDYDDKWTATFQRDEVNAWWAAGKSLDYLSSAMAYSGVDGKGTAITVAVDYGSKHNNAYGGGTTVTFGGGDGTTYGSWASVDVVGHELGHCVTDANAALIYAGESGHLNESFSDVMGALVERNVDGASSSDTWKIAEDVYLTGDALRYMGNPASDGASFDYYSSASAVASADVHYGSGIPNLAFYLLVNGGSHPTRGGTAVTPISAEAAAWIWFRAHRDYMTSGSGFNDARAATIQAATDGYGSTSWVVSSVQAAWNAVGVTGSGCENASHTATGETDWFPGGTYYYAAAGTHTLDATPWSETQDVSLSLYKWSGSAWTLVSSANAGTTGVTETMNYVGTAGYFTWGVASVSGTGSYTACTTHP